MAGAFALVVLALGAALILLLPITQEYVLHFARGLQGQDWATPMRFGAYQDALTLIGRYPVLGVGFAGAPEIDFYLGVSTAYLVDEADGVWAFLPENP